MLIQALVETQHLDAPAGPKNASRPLRSCLMTKKSNNVYYLTIRNSKYPNCIDYRVSDLNRVHDKFIDDGKLGLGFKHPRHMVLIRSDDKPALKLFLRQISNMFAGKKVNVAARPMPKTVPAAKVRAADRFDPESREFTAVDRFDRRVLNMRHLSCLVLENCTLPSLPQYLGRLPIVHLSLSHSRLAASQYDQDTFWDWMIEDTIGNSLTTLKMDAVGLKTLPFEILCLKNLENLSLSKNKLTYLPQYIGQLKKLKSLNVAENLLAYFPYSLYRRTFNELNISNNKFARDDVLEFDHIYLYLKLLDQPNERSKENCVKKLSHAAFFRIIENSVKFKRQDIPRTLWHYFNVVGRCVLCNRFILPHCSVVSHTNAAPAVLNIVRNHYDSYIPWQNLTCRLQCVKSCKFIGI